MAKHKPPKKANPYIAGASGVGHFDWFEAGRKRAGTVLWTEDVSNTYLLAGSFYIAVVHLTLFAYEHAAV